VAEGIDVSANVLPDQEIPNMEAYVAFPSALGAGVRQAVPERRHLIYVWVCYRHHVRNLTAEIDEHARHRSTPGFSENAMCSPCRHHSSPEQITKAAATTVKVMPDQARPSESSPGIARAGMSGC
jgi:hypothetical protein